MLSRRRLIESAGRMTLGAAALPLMKALTTSAAEPTGMRCINIVNFIRAVEPRFKTDLLLPVQEQMKLIKQRGLPATWLLQFDALVSGPFVEFLKANMAPGHEVGFWFEMNEMHCKAAGVEWRGRPNYEWDHIPNVAFTIGYSPEERIKLADTAMAEFKRIWDRYPNSVASWNLDSDTMAHLVERYRVEAFAVCRDQIATDGFTIWGTPIAGYFPSKLNCWSPALDRSNQIDAPVFRMLGQDPVYYYQREYPVPGGRRTTEPDTMEPVWTSGKSSTFVERFFDMLSHEPTGQFSYAQMGQENSFPWDQQKDAYPRQMESLAKLRGTGSVIVETMGETGRRFKKAFKQTPVQAQVQLQDPFDNSDPPERTIWYQSRFYRANLHFRGDEPFFRDITVYSDRFEQPFLHEATRLTEVEQRGLAILDGYHWAEDHQAKGSIFLEGEPVRLSGNPSVRQEPDALLVELPVAGGKLVVVRFDETSLSVTADKTVGISFAFDAQTATFQAIDDSIVRFKSEGFEYQIKTVGHNERTESGWSVTGREVTLQLRQAR